MSKTAIASLLAIAVSLLVAIVILGPKSDTLEKRVELLRPHLTISYPTSEGPHPVVTLYHGCGGLVGAEGRPKVIMDNYAKVAVEHGYIAMIVDSFSPREISFGDRWEVCTGLTLQGWTRAGDVAAAAHYAADLPDAAPSGHVLAGWSHGGWSLMEAMTYDGVTTWPAYMRRPKTDPFRAVSGVYLTYPYCGILTEIQGKGWVKPLIAKAVMAEFDSISDLSECEKSFESVRQTGSTLDVKIFAGVTHAFDEPDHPDTSKFVHDPGAAKLAHETFGEYLEQLASLETR